MVVPRAERSLLIRFVYVGMWMLFSVLARRRKSYEARDALLARYAPTTLMFLPVVWATGVIYGFSLMFWALDVRPYREALTLSGWSLTTLGYRATTDFFTLTLAGFEALIGLGIVAFLISFLPTMYSAFSVRESAVARLEIRAGTPPTPEAMIILAHETGGLEDMEATWTEWEHWFIHIEETHQSYPALAYFRSVRSDRSWVTAAGCILDTAAIMLSTVAVPHSPAAPFMIRAGYVCAAQRRRVLRHQLRTRPVAHGPDNRAPRRVLRDLRVPPQGRGPGCGRPRTGVARLRRVAGELRRLPGGAGFDHLGPARQVELRPALSLSPAAPVLPSPAPSAAAPVAPDSTSGARSWPAAVISPVTSLQMRLAP